MAKITLEVLTSLYVKYAEPLAKVRDEQRNLLAARQPHMKAQLDDYEAEITYLLLRAHAPRTVVEIGTLWGWSTTWILSALRDNGSGRLHSFDIVDNVERTVPAELSEGRWTFTKGDVRNHLDQVPTTTDYLFIDADHGLRFARWYVKHLLPRVPAGIPASVHDVFHGRRAKLMSEGSVVLKWLAEQGVEYFTPSTARNPDVARHLAGVKRELGLDEPIRPTRANPMIFFNLPERAA